MRRRSLLVAYLAASAAVLAVGTQAAPTPSFVIQGDQALAGVPVGAPRGALERRLGGPDSARQRGPYECVLRWRKHRLVVNLLDLSQRAPCRVGIFRAATVTGRVWRTAKGLRVGSSVAELRALYPRARRERGGHVPWRGWWLVSRRTCPETGSVPYPGLLARERAGRVTALVISVTACE